MKLISSAQKKYLLHATLVATLLATAYYKYQDSLKSNPEVVEASSFSVRGVETSNKEEKNSADEKKEVATKVDIFEVYKKIVPEPVVKEAVKPQIISKPVAIVPASPPLPVAPIIPFKYIGKIFGDNEYQVFVGFNGKYFALKEGDIIQQTYKIEKITPPIMTVTYIPMSILQDMQIGEPN